MATLLDTERPVKDVDENENQEDLLSHSEELQEEQVEETSSEESSIPDKYKGKSTQEIIQMHQEAEKLLGKQSSEVGDLRKVVDEYITQQTQLVQKQQPVEEEIDFFSEPDKAVSKAIEKHPSVQQAQQMALQYQKATALNQLQMKHPDMQEILADTKFIEWVTSSNVRKKLLAQADQQYDVESADELFSLWKERKQMVTETVKAETSQRKQQVKAASTGSASGSANSGSKKIYRRQDIIDLMRDNPDRYQALSAEIMKAYAEKRVR